MDPVSHRTVGAAVLLITAGALGCHRPEPTTGTTTPPADLANYRAAAARIADATRTGEAAYRRVAALADLFGPRKTGSPALEKAIVWAHDTFVADGQENVALDPVRVPIWERGKESAEIVGGSESRRLAILGLGGSVATPPGGLTAEVAVVSSLEELAKLGPAARGKIVLFNRPFRMPPAVPNAAAGYGELVPTRTEGPTRAAALGAVATLVRSLASASLGAPHAGQMHYGPGPQIPAAAVSVEDAELLARLVARGAPVNVHLVLEDGPLPDAPSFNVLAELRGREHPEEIVVIGAHIDSWDVGEGAQDDGAGCAIVMESLATLRRLGLIPRRTIRAVLFTSEEEGAQGGKTYAEAHAQELSRHVAAFETDIGAGTPLGFRIDAAPEAVTDLRGLVALVAPLGATSIDTGFSGADISHLRPAGVPLLGLFSDPTHYFDVHHSVADTLEKIDPATLGRNVAAMATMAYVVADRATRWPLAPQSEHKP
ncbi:MAG TPA: M20/M25/M40 family metallo-hydrolase [Polyangia bacterium]|nr:M20/M25/M40 family metallo-hydrolase [Polyangia bacterium]